MFYVDDRSTIFPCLSGREPLFTSTAASQRGRAHRSPPPLRTPLSTKVKLTLTFEVKLIILKHEH